MSSPIGLPSSIPIPTRNLDAIVYPATLVPGPYRVYVTGIHRAADGSVRTGIADCLRECGQPAAGASSQSNPRDGDSLGVGRGASAAHPADARREPAPLFICRHRGSAARVVDRTAASPTRSAQPPHHPRGSSGLARAAVHRSGLARYRPGVWNGSRSAQRPRRCGSGVEGRNKKRRPAQIAAAHRAADWRDCHLRGVAGLRHAVRAQPAARQLHRSRIRHPQYRHRHARSRNTRIFA